MKEWDIHAMNVNMLQLNRAIWNEHEGVRYPCGEWEYVATQSSNLKRHKESKHEEVRYPCDECEYVATQSSSFKQHKESKHEGVRYPCGEWEYVATRVFTLKQLVLWRTFFARLPMGVVETTGSDWGSKNLNILVLWRALPTSYISSQCCFGFCR